jgi:hypothetical protein
MSVVKSIAEQYKYHNNITKNGKRNDLINTENKERKL